MHRGPLLRATAAVALLLGMAVTGIHLERARPAPAARCALPAGLRLEALAPREQALVVRRAMLCSDVEHGRIDAGRYLAALAALDAAPLPSRPSPAPLIWAGRVLAMSSQYSAERWSAARALGAPDVPVVGVDHVNAWASLGADDQPEFLEVALAQPAQLSAVEVFESFNPGAISEVTLIGESGTRTVVQQGVPGAGLLTVRPSLRFELPECTQEKIVAIRVAVDSQKVPGWNEIDAIGGQPCQ